ncbi:MAG: O-antigen ligase family protein [bacterium]
MNRSIAQAESYKTLVKLLGLVVAAAIAVAIGLRLAIQINVWFYGLLFVNVLTFAYFILAKDITYSVLIYFYSLVFFNWYWQVPLPGKLPDLDIPRLVFTFMWAIFLLEIAMGTRTLLPRTNAELAMLALVTAIIISMAITGGKTHIRMLLNGYALPYAAFVLSKNLLSSRQTVERLVKYLALPLALYFPLNQMFEHYNINRLVFPPYILNPRSVGAFTYFEVSGRAMGAFLHPSATVFAMCSAYLLALWYTGKSPSKTGKIYAIILTFLVPPAVFFSYTRSAYLGFLVAMFILLLLSGRSKIFAIAVIVAAGLGILANWENVKTEKRDVGGLAIKETAQSRLAHVYAARQMFADKPLTGFGFERFQESVPTYLAEVRRTLLGYRGARIGRELRMHNFFLSILVELGLMGFIPLVLIYYYIIKHLHRAVRRPCPVYDRDFVVAVIAILATWFTISMFIESRFFEYMNVLVMTFVGIVIGGQQKMDLGLLNNSERGDQSESSICRS